MHKSIANILENWVEKINQDEFYFDNAFQQLIQEKSSVEAFEFIPHMVDAILSINDDYIVSELIFYLNCLYGKANTTEIHPTLSAKLEDLEKHITNLKGEYSAREFKEFKRDLRL